jgi:hypothetical protein
MSIAAVVILYVIPLLFFWTMAITCLFSKNIAKQVEMETLGDIAVVFMIGLCPVVNVACMILCFLVVA